MQRRRSIRTTNEGRSVQVREEKPVPQPTAPSAPSKQVGKEIVDHLNGHLPKVKPSGQSIQELVEKAQKEALSGYQIGKGISKSWVDSQYGGMSQQAYAAMVAKYNKLLQEKVQGEVAASLKPYSGQQYPQSTTISAPPGYEPLSQEPQIIPPGALKHPGLGWAPNSGGIGQLISQALDKFSLEKALKIVVDPTLPEDIMVTLGPNGQPIIVQLQKQDAALLKPEA